MKVILLQDIRSLGRKGEIKEVKDGYALHHLFPKKLARMATLQNVSALKQAMLQKQKKLDLQIASFKKQIKKLQHVVLEIKMKASKEGRLFAQVTEKMIAKDLKVKGFDVQDSHIQLPKAIKEVGDYVVTVSYGHDVPNVDIKVKVSSLA